MVRGAIFWGAIFLRGNCSGSNFPWGQLSGGQFSSGAIVLEPERGDSDLAIIHTRTYKLRVEKPHDNIPHKLSNLAKIYCKIKIPESKFQP